MASNCRLFTQALLLIIYVIYYSTLINAAPHLIKKLPGFIGDFPSKHYSGYVSIDKHRTKHLFYYYVESERNPAKDPVVLWLNGGPGCSSLGGFVYEHGPFTFEASGLVNSEDLPKLHLNPNSWSKISNIIYLDSPVGTGFSFSRNSSDYKTIGDLKTAFHTHKFLLKWFKMFPERLHNPFFIAGESYAGVYIPTLASEIMKGLDSSLRPIINLKGYMIGNGVTDKFMDGNAGVRFAHATGLISDDLYREIVDTCHGSYLTPSSKKCKSKLEKFENVTMNLNQYNILQQCYDFYYDEGYRCDSCINYENSNMDDKKLPRSFGKSRLKQRPRKIHWRTITAHGIRSSHSQLTSNISILCHDDMAPDLWLNNKRVRQAIHAAEERDIGRWDYCTDRLAYKHDGGSMIKYHKRLTSKGLRVLIYSGDQDMVVPYIGSEAWTRSLGYKIIDEWRPWISNGQVAGFTQAYDKNLTFLTIKGAGHIVPQDKPREALDFYSRWLRGKNI